MNESSPQPLEPATPYPQRMPDGPAITADLEALVGRPFIRSLMERVMEFQEREYAGTVQIDWQAGTYYTGVFAAHLATGEASFRDAALGWGRAAKWKIGSRPFYADDICMGQTMLDLYLLDRNPDCIKDLALVLEAYFEKNTVTAAEVHSHFLKPGDHVMRGRNLWWWSDALYMAPPVLARMYAATGEQRYLDLLHRLYWDTNEFLFDQESSLFYRDESFFPPDRAAALERDKIFWSRGNGWVYAGLVRVIDHLPSDDPFRARYLALFHTLTRKLVTLQKTDGLWPSWLNRPDLEQSPEVSGSCFFTYGLLAGINRGWLDKRSYLPLALRAWRGLTAKLGTDGRLGFAQLVDSAPGPVRPESSIDYTHGGFLLAASELYTLNLSQADLRSLEPRHQPRLMMNDASWTCLNSERAVLADEHAYLGAVNSAGRTKLYAYRLNPNNAPSILNGSADLGSWMERDDRNHPALLRFGYKLLAVYSGRGTGGGWSWRIATIPKELPEWGAMKIKWSEEGMFPADSVGTSGSSLVRLSAENGRIYHFFGGSDLTWSDDDGVTWEPAVRFMVAPGSCVSIADNGRDRIDIVFIDPADNGLHHIFYQDGAFHSCGGRLSRSLREVSEKPLTSADATRIHGGCVSVQNLGYDRNGLPVAVFVTSSESGGFHYRSARWDGCQWISSQIACAGTSLHQNGSHDAGGITLDPDNDGVVYLSTNVDPVTGVPNATGFHQLFRGVADETGENHTWEQLTFDANRDNIRPYVPRGHGDMRCVLWLRGTYRSHSDYQMDIYGLVGSSAAERSIPAVSDASEKAPTTQRAAKSQVPSALRQAV
jgi:rhamnogalacturonyl hydrolase YesR